MSFPLFYTTIQKQQGTSWFRYLSNFSKLYHPQNSRQGCHRELKSERIFLIGCVEVSLLGYYHECIINYLVGLEQNTKTEGNLSNGDFSCIFQSVNITKLF